MLKLGRVTKVKVLFLVMIFVFNFDLFKFSAAILEKGLFSSAKKKRSRCAILGEGAAEEKEFKMFRLSLLFISVFILECFTSSSNKVRP